MAQNMQAWLQANLQLFQDVVICAALLPAYFDLDWASGAQLDVLGSIVGAARTVGFQPSNGVSPILDDDTYRVLIRATIAANHWDGTIGGLLNAWQFIFPGSLLIVDDNQDMTVNIYVGVGLTSILQDLVLKGYIIPRPEGVLYNISIATLPMFGFDQENSFIASVDQGKWV